MLTCLQAAPSTHNELRPSHNRVCFALTAISCDSSFLPSPRPSPAIPDCRLLYDFVVIITLYRHAAAAFPATMPMLQHVVENYGHCKGVANDAASARASTAGSPLLRIPCRAPLAHTQAHSPTLTTFEARILLSMALLKSLSCMPIISAPSLLLLR